MSEPACGTCRFSEVRMGDDGEPRMVCCRYPPVLIVLGDEPVRMNTDVDADDWCGEYAPRTE